MENKSLELILENLSDYLDDVLIDSIIEKINENGFETVAKTLLEVDSSEKQKIALMLMKEDVETLDSLASVLIGTQELNEKLVKRVNSKGVVTRIKDRKTRARLATQTTGISKSKRRLIAKKAARTKKRNPAGMKRAIRKRKRTLRKRKALGIKNS